MNRREVVQCAVEESLYCDDLSVPDDDNTLQSNSDVVRKRRRLAASKFRVIIDEMKRCFGDQLTALRDMKTARDRSQREDCLRRLSACQCAGEVIFQRAQESLESLRKLRLDTGKFTCRIEGLQRKFDRDRVATSTEDENDHEDDYPLDAYSCLTGCAQEDNSKW